MSKEISACRIAAILDSDLPHSANNIAWAFVESVEAQQYIRANEALRFAGKAVHIDRDPNHLDTLAAVHAQLGDSDKAILLQK